MSGDGTKDGDRLGGGGGIEVPTLGHSSGDRREEAEAGSVDTKALVSMAGMSGLR